MEDEVSRPGRQAGRADAFLLFAYGTLKRGGCYHFALAGQTYLREARTRPIYALYHLGNYPGLKAVTEGGQVVHGELYRVGAGLRGRLDEIEGAPECFALAPVELDENPGPVWAYFFQGYAGRRPPIPSGTWDNG